LYSTGTNNPEQHRISTCLATGQKKLFNDSLKESLKNLQYIISLLGEVLQSGKLWLPAALSKSLMELSICFKEKQQQIAEAQRIDNYGTAKLAEVYTSQRNNKLLKRRGVRFTEKQQITEAQRCTLHRETTNY
jgi:hypothetical protein